MYRAPNARERDILEAVVPIKKSLTGTCPKTPSIIPKKEKIEIIFKKPSFFLGFRFLDEISLSTFVNKILSFKFRFNTF